MGAVQTEAKIKEALINGAQKTKEFIKKGAQVVKKVLDSPGTKDLINTLTKMTGIPVNVGDIIYQGADIISTGTEFGENMFSNKPRKNILKDPNKFDFTSKFNRMSNLIKTRKPT
jgi:hypothetical protein